MKKKIKCTRCQGEGTIEKHCYDYPCQRCLGKGYLLVSILDGIPRADID